MKKFLKSSLSFILAITFLFSSAVVGLSELDLGGFFAVKASAASVVESGTCGENLTWTLDDEGTLTISGTGEMYDYHPLTSSLVGSDFAPWFTYRESIEAIVLAPGVTKIGSGAFQYCINPTSVTIPVGVVEIGDGAFHNCTNLIFVGIPDSVTSIGESVFYGCTALTSIVFSDSVTSIGSSVFHNTAYYNDVNNWENDVLYNGNHLIEAKTSLSGDYIVKAGTKSIAASAFSDCTNLTSVTIQNGVSSIVGSVFSGCTSLSSVVIPDTVVSIGDYTFRDCSKLTAINVGVNNSYYSSVDGVLFNKDKTILLQYPAGKSSIEYVVPESVTSIYDYAFYGCTSLASVTIPDSVTSIGESVFDNSKKLNAINVTGNNTNYSSADGVLFNKDKTILVRYPEGKTSTEYKIPDSVTTIGYLAFDRCENLVLVEISDNTETIQPQAFNCCTNLATAIAPKSLKSIGMMAFVGCQNFSRILYKGTEEEWKNVTIENILGINSLGNAIVYYNYTSECEHTSSDWIIDTPASVSAPGSKHKECTVCHEVLETVAIAQLKPATPKVATTNEIGGVNITWNAVDGAAKYQIYRRQGGSNTWTLVGTTTGTSLLDKNVQSGIYYVYSVRAYNNAGQYSDFVSANTQTRKFMAVPKLKGISNATNGLYITWEPVAGITNGYRVYRRGAGSTYWTYLGTTKNTYFTDTAVKNNSGEYFRYTVIADGGYHSKFDTTGLYLRRLSNPTLKSATSASAGITVKWTPVKGCLGYYVYRKTADSNWVRVGVVNGVNSSSYLDKTAKKGVTYTYTVRAVCGSYISYFNSGISCKDKY